MNVFFPTADISAIAKIYGKPVERDGESFMMVEKMVVDFTMKNARFKVKDNVNTQNVLGECALAIAKSSVSKHILSICFRRSH